MKYVYLNDEHKVHEILPEYSPLFPGIPIQQRYSKAYLMHCMPVEDFVEVEQGMQYIPEQNRFVRTEEDYN